MAMILTTAFLAVTALALPNPPPVTTITTLVPPTVHPVTTVTVSLPSNAPSGARTGQNFDDGLTFKPYKEVDCHGEAAAVYTGQYGLWEAYQMQSYSLSRALRNDEQLDFFAGIDANGNINNTADNSKNGHFTLSCFKFDVRAGANATTSDVGKDPKFHGRDEGCHTLVHNEWCANLWLDV